MFLIDVEFFFFFHSALWFLSNSISDKRNKNKENCVYARYEIILQWHSHTLGIS